LRTFAVVTAVFALSLIDAAAAGASTTTASGTYSGGTTPLARAGFPPTDCLNFGSATFTGNPCLFEGTGTMTGTTGDGDPFVAGYQAHLQWAPVNGCAPVSGEVWFAPGWTDPNAGPPPTGYLRVTVDSSQSQACVNGTPTFAAQFTIHLEGTIDGVGVGPWENAVGTFERDGTLTFNFAVPGVDSGTFSLSYTTPDPLPTSADQCDHGGWEVFGIFKNHGDCVSFVATHGKNEPGQNVPN
jgi:hypothetical protein